MAEDGNHYPFHGKTIPGIAFTLTDRDALDSPAFGIEIISALHQLYPQFALAKAQQIIANVDTMQALSNKEDPRAIAASWASDLAKFQSQRQPYLLYR